MTDRERLSNLEEMVADVFIRLDKVESMLRNMPALGDSKKYDIKSLEEEEVKQVLEEVRSLKSMARTLKSEIESIKNRLDSNPS